MNIGSLFLSLGIKGDTKSLDDAIKKVEELKKQTQELNKALKETKSNTKLNVSTGGASSGKNLKESQILREEAAVGAAKLRIAKTELGFVNLEEQAKKKQEKEQKKREKDREKATKDFFNQIENGFSFVAKAFTGGLVAGGIGGYITAQASKQAALSASLREYGIDPEKSQRYANVFRVASGGQVGVQETNAMIKRIEDMISNSEMFNPEIGNAFVAAGIDATEVKDFDSFIKLARNSLKDPRYSERNLTTLLGKIGVPDVFSPAFGKNFSDKEFEDAYKNAKINTNQQVEDAKKINLAFAQLENSFDVFKGDLLSRFAKSIEKWINFVNKLLTPENLEKLTEKTGDLKEVGEGLLAGYLGKKGLEALFKAGGGKAGKVGLRQGLKAVGFGATRLAGVAGLGYSAYEAYKYFDQKNQELYERSFGKPRYGKKKPENNDGSSSPENNNKSSFKYHKKSSDFIYSDKSTKDLLSFMDRGSIYLPSEKELSAEQRRKMLSDTAVNPINNINTNVTINADSVDKTTAPYIADQINSNVNKTIYNSKYPTLTVPK